MADTVGKMEAIEVKCYQVTRYCTSPTESTRQRQQVSVCARDQEPASSNEVVQTCSQTQLSVQDHPTGSSGRQ